MSEPTCHEWVPNVWLCFDREAGRRVVTDAKYCPVCGTRLNADGTVTPMVPAVTSEAVRATDFFAILDRAVSNHPAYDGWYVACENHEWGVILAALAAVGAPTSERADAGPSDSELLDALEWAATDGATICGEQCCEGEHSRWTAEGDGLHLKANCVYDLASAIHFSPKPAPEPDHAHQRAGEGAGR